MVTRPRRTGGSLPASAPSRAQTPCTDPTSRGKTAAAILIGILNEIAVRLSANVRRGGEDGRRLRPPAVVTAKVVEEFLLLAPCRLLLLMLLLHTCIVRPVQVIHAPLLRIGQSLVRVGDALETLRCIRVIRVLVGMVPAHRARLNRSALLPSGKTKVESRTSEPVMLLFGKVAIGRLMSAVVALRFTPSSR